MYKSILFISCVPYLQTFYTWKKSTKNNILKMFLFLVFLISTNAIQVLHTIEVSQPMVGFSTGEDHVMVTGIDSTTSNIYYFSTLDFSLTQIGTTSGMSVAYTSPNDTLTSNRILVQSYITFGANIYEDNLTNLQWSYSSQLIGVQNLGNNRQVITKYGTPEIQIYDNSISHCSIPINRPYTPTWFEYLAPNLFTVVRNTSQTTLLHINVDTCSVQWNFTDAATDSCVLGLDDAGQYFAYTIDNRIIIREVDGMVVFHEFVMSDDVNDLEFLGQWLFASADDGAFVQYDYKKKEVVKQESFGVGRFLFSTREYLVMMETGATSILIAGTRAPDDDGNSDDSDDGGSNEVAMQSIGYGLSVGGLRTATRPIFPLLIFLQDVWYYKYHRTEYPSTMKLFMNDIDIINQYRLVPQYLNPQSYQLQILNDSNYNTQYHKSVQYSQTDPEQIYFLHSTKPIYLWNVLFNLGLFILLKVLAKLTSQFGFLGRVHAFLKLHTKWWVLFVTLLDENVLTIVFCAFVQLSAPYAFVFVHKVNLAITIMVLFLVLMYAVVFPLMLHKRHSSALHVYTKVGWRGLLLEVGVIQWRRITRSFIHAFLIGDYRAQLVCLVVHDVIFFIVVAVSRRLFLYGVLWGLLLGFFAGFLIFDVVLLAGFDGRYEMDGQGVKVLLFGLFSVVILEVIVMIGLSVVEVVKEWREERKKESKQIHPTNKTNQKNKKLEEQKHDEHDEHVHNTPDDEFVEHVPESEERPARNSQHGVKKTRGTRARLREILEIIFQHPEQS